MEVWGRGGEERVVWGGGMHAVWRGVWRDREESDTTTGVEHN